MGIKYNNINLAPSFANTSFKKNIRELTPNKFMNKLLALGYTLKEKKKNGKV